MRLKHDNKHIYHWHTHTHKTKTSNQIDWHLPKKKVKPKTQEMNWQLNKLAEHLSVFSNFIRHLLVFTILYLSAMKVKSENCFPTTFEHHVNIVCVLLQFHQSSLSFCVSVDCNGTGLLYYQSINHINVHLTKSILLILESVLLLCMSNKLIWSTLHTAAFIQHKIRLSNRKTHNIQMSYTE